MTPIPEFNPATSRAQAPQFMGYSRGGQGTNAFGKLFEGIGDAIGMAAEGADRAIQENIKEDVYQGYDEANREFGVDAATVFQQDGPQLPGDIQNAGEQLQAMSDAVAAGTLRDSHYYARMEALTRRLRARYPGYREQIDDMVAGVTGVKPANALRRSIMQEQEANATASDAARSKFMTYIQQNEEYAQPDIYEGLASGKYTEMDARVFIAKNKQAKQKVEADRANLALAADQKQATQGEAFTLAKQEAGMWVNDVFSKTTAAMGGSSQAFNDLIARSQDPTGPGGASVTPEEEAAIRSNFGVLKAGFQDTLLRRMQQPLMEGSTNSYATILSKEQQDEIMATAMSRMTVMEQALIDKDWGLLAAKQNEIEARKAQSVIDVVNGPGGDFLQKAQAIKDLVGPEFFTFLMSNNTGAMAEYSAAVNSLITQSISDARPLMDQVNTLKQSGVDDYRAYNQLFKTFADSITTDKISGAGAERLAVSVFGPGNERLLQGLRTNDDRIAVFNMLTSNSMTAKIAELSKNNPQLWDMYQGWSLRSFTTLFKDVADTVQDSVVSNPNLEITYDPESNQFKADFIRGGGELTTTVLGRPFGLFDEGMNAIQTSEATKAIGTINEALRRVAPILQQDGLDTGEELAKAFESMGINLQAQRQPDFWKGLGQAVMDAVKGDSLNDQSIQDSFKRKGSATGKGGSQQGTNPLAPSSVFDFRDGMSDSLSDSIGDDDLPGYTGPDNLASMRAELDARINTLSNPQGSSPVSKLDASGSRVAQNLNANPEAPQRAGDLLTFIGNLEAPLGYNQVYGKNRMAPLDEMTVSQVLNFQRDMVKKGSPSSAVGRYQFIRGTLRGLVRELGLTGEEKFTPELQDKLALHLMNRRGLNRYLEGRMSLEQFGNSLAKEWASLPVVSGKKKGRSYYAGDGLNKSLTKVEDTLAAIQAMAS